MRARLDSAETDLEREILEAALAASRLDAGASAEPPAAPNLAVGTKVRYGGFHVDDDDDDDDDDGDDERVLMPQRGRSVPPDSMEGVWSAKYTAVSMSHHPTLCHGRGDKVLLPTTALAALTEAMEAQKGTPRLPKCPIHSCCGACMCAHFPP